MSLLLVTLAWAPRLPSGADEWLLAAGILAAPLLAGALHRAIVRLAARRADWRRANRLP